MGGSSHFGSSHSSLSQTLLAQAISPPASRLDVSGTSQYNMGCTGSRMGSTGSRQREAATSNANSQQPDIPGPAAADGGHERRSTDDGYGRYGRRSSNASRSSLGSRLHLPSHEQVRHALNPDNWPWENFVHIQAPGAAPSPQLIQIRAQIHMQRQADAASRLPAGPRAARRSSAPDAVYGSSSRAVEVPPRRGSAPAAVQCEFGRGSSPQGGPAQVDSVGALEVPPLRGRALRCGGLRWTRPHRTAAAPGCA
eukprot:NODE_2706_length_891_cov_214.812201.p1 GENE.NODE_2706_length_891_cov_214.812201~~NODE_2706_length_891_cov_214.812201.p1  ORF type:complete len:253 (-),score=4.38 NODE_2706_length_891_cov_214.812201:116-874(-)